MENIIKKKVANRGKKFPMSTRRADERVTYADALRQELSHLRHAAMTKAPIEEAVKDVTEMASTNAHTELSLKFDDLSPTEQAAASLGAQPDAFKPIGWLNEAHFDALLKSNSLSNDLTRRLLAYKVVASGGK